ncbi:MAG: glycosyltransferase, partial [Actinobacteria bacterium]|nr:glycosyltransferase [Actinomycetota bacterium]
MRVVIDGVPIRGQSLAIVVDNLLRGWASRAEDELHIVTSAQAEIRIPASVRVHRVDLGRRAAVGRLRAQSVDVPRVCRAVGADVLLGVLPTTTVTPLPCPRALISYDLRYEQRPEQYGRAARLLRKYSYELGYRQADAIMCISDRTRQDLLARRPWLRNRPVTVTHLGADQAASWPAAPTPRVGRPYALAFGQYGNKNVDLVVDAWARLGATPPLDLTIVGLGDTERAAVRRRIDALGLGEHVTARNWLSDAEFQATFTAASMIVFPSDFEGFGMPAVEAMWLGIPLVITPEKALLEVCAGHAVV